MVPEVHTDISYLLEKLTASGKNYDIEKLSLIHI